MKYIILIYEILKVMIIVFGLRMIDISLEVFKKIPGSILTIFVFFVWLMLMFIIDCIISLIMKKSTLNIMNKWSVNVFNHIFICVILRWVII